MSETAILGGGCFWCLEAVFLELRGVLGVASGYAGGHTPSPTYGDVCGGRTGHAEVVRIEFDPDVLAYTDLLRVFFTVHDPTTPNRQGADVGTQYRSIILCQSEEQRARAVEVIAEMASIWSAPIVTELAPAGAFHRAEQTHQDYYARNPLQPYCLFVVAPKVRHFRKAFADRLGR